MPDRLLPHPPGRATTVVSPCVRNCCLDDNDICLGCFRSLEEITAWGGATDHRRRCILASAAQRKRRLSR